MGEIPSSAMIAIISTIIAVIIFTSFIYVFKSQDSIDNAKQSKVNQMDKVTLSDDYLQYAGSTLTGEKVKAVIKSSRREDLRIYVQFATDSYIVFEFQDGSGNYYLKASDSMYDSTASFNDAYQWTSDYTKSGWYINPVDDYSCEVHQSSSGEVTELYFLKV